MRRALMPVMLTCALTTVIAIAAVAFSSSALNAAEENPCGVGQPKCACASHAINPYTGEMCSLSSWSCGGPANNCFQDCGYSC